MRATNLIHFRSIQVAVAIPARDKALTAQSAQLKPQAPSRVDLAERIYTTWIGAVRCSAQCWQAFTIYTILKFDKRNA